MEGIIGCRLGIIKKVDTQLHVTRIRLAEEVGIPVSTLKKYGK
jgi:hypothetical protein